MTPLETKTYAGKLYDGGKGIFALSLKDSVDPDQEFESLVELLQDEISGKLVTVRYWITDQKTTKEEAQEEFLKTLFGVLDARFSAHYSEATGFLWADEELNVGGHDLFAELESHMGKWLILEIDIHSS